MSDLLIKNGRLVDPARKLDRVTDLLIRDGKIVSIGAIAGVDAPTFDATMSLAGATDQTTERQSIHYIFHRQ